MRALPTWVLVFLMGSCSVWGQAATTDSDVREGHALAIMLCANCHLAAPDQPYEPLSKPPAPSFASIAQRKDINADTLKHFLTTTRRGLDNPKGMPNPTLTEYQLRPIVAYILSLRK